MLGDLNGRIRNEEMLVVMGKYEVPGNNVSGERLLGDGNCDRKYLF